MPMDEQFAPMSPERLNVIVSRYIIVTNIQPKDIWLEDRQSELGLGIGCRAFW
jgi:hypothetical protein